MTEDIKTIRNQLTEVGNSVNRAHERIDSLAEDLSSMRGDVHKITAQVEPMRHNLQTITDCIVEKGIGPAPHNDSSVVMCKIIDAIKHLIVASIFVATLSAIGYYGIQAKGRSGNSEIELRKSAE